MNSRKDIQRELELYNSSLPFDVRTPVFDLPKSYFENFAADVLAKIKGQTADTAAEELKQLSPLLSGLPKKTPYALPDDYFATTLAPETIRNEDPVPGWGAAGRTMPYTVPTGYFAQLPARVQERVAPAGGARVVSMFARKWVPYAAAAVVAGVLVLGGFLYSGNKAAIDPTAEPQAWVAKKLHNVSNQELEEFILFTEPGNEPAQQTASNQRDVRKLLRDVSSSELDAFLNQVPAETELIN